MSEINTLYIVDHDEDDLFVIREAISDLKISAQVHYASNGRELLEMLSKDARDALILVDMNMPLLNGVETLEAISEGFADPEVNLSPILKI